MRVELGFVTAYRLDLFLPNAGDISNEIRLTRKVEGDPVNGVWLVGSIHSWVRGSDLCQPCEHDRFRRGESRLNVIAMTFVRQPGIRGKDEIGLEQADVLER